MKVQIVNASKFQLIVDIDGNDNTDDQLVLGAGAKDIVELPSEKRFIDLSKEFKGKLIIRKVKGV